MAAVISAYPLLALPVGHLVPDDAEVALGHDAWRVGGVAPGWAGVGSADHDVDAADPSALARPVDGHDAGALPVAGLGQVPEGHTGFPEVDPYPYRPADHVDGVAWDPAVDGGHMFWSLTISIACTTVGFSYAPVPHRVPPPRVPARRVVLG
jgi:hypothetical protein